MPPWGIALIVVLIVLAALNIVAVISGASIDGIGGLIAIVVGFGLLRYQFSRGRDLPGRLGCLSWILPLIGAWAILRGAYAGVVFLIG